MGARWFKGSYDERIIVVEARSDGCVVDCWNIGLVQVENPFENDSGFTQRKGSYLAPGIVDWYEKPDHAAIARRQQVEAQQQAEAAALQEQQAAKEKADRETKEEQERTDREAKETQERVEREAKKQQERAEREAQEQERVDQTAQRVAKAREIRLSQLVMLNIKRDQSQEQNVDAHLLGLEQDVQTQSEMLTAALRQYEENGYDAAITERIVNELEDRKATAQEQRRRNEFKTVIMT